MQEARRDLEAMMMPVATHAGAATIGRALAVWLLLLAVANVNGGVRELLIVPRLGAPLAHALSTLMLATFILALAWWTIRWVGPASALDALLVGAIWLTLTLMFEFLAGHYLFGSPWDELLANYEFWRGRLWVLVPVVVLLAPWLAGRGHGIVAG
jgi:hypothetical protein